MNDQPAAPQPAQQTCNCRWDGEVQVQQCTLHAAHVEAVHEWAGRAKAAEAKLTEQPAPVAKPHEQERMAWVYDTGKGYKIVGYNSAAIAHLDNGTLLVPNAPQPAQQEPLATLKDEVIGCFNAAFVEGLQEALAETQDEHLKDLVERRLMHALYAAQEIEGKK